MDSVHSQVLQAGINWWSSPKAWESSIDSSGYLKEKAIPLIIKMADELSRRSKNNGNVSSDNQNILTVTCIILVIVGSIAVGYIFKNQKEKKINEKEKAQRLAQLNQLMLWRQEVMARQGAIGGGGQVVYDQRNEIP